ncbi:formate/nitrite transporter family protein [Metasolibacillus sp. FSL H7-0170]|uniref:formate/nitrite transporter family protein n=1 Tax=Metasolibacillus TaxID=2703677 RepID=UPI0007976558|nr:formate/nitrite transporter family protein [Metasolibacillus fluoroglycofenilyticus]KYG91447.1 hypothetical protein A0U40_00405 [[Bacillus] sp. KCTC 13219]
MLQKIISTALHRNELYKYQKLSYLINTMLGGIYIGFGMLLLMTLGGQMTDLPVLKLLQGATFGIALTMVIMAGADLFTGNALIMPISSFHKSVSWLHTYKLFFTSYIGNLIGALLLAITFVATGLVSGALADYVITASTGKIAPSFLALFARGVLCNVLVCLAVWGSFKLQSESAKILFTFCCILPFITMSFEHSIANMTLFAVAYFMPDSPFIASDFIYNLIPVTLGNIAGGMFVAFVYWHTALKGLSEKSF